MPEWARVWREFPLWRGRLIMPMSLACALWSAYNGLVLLTGNGLARAGGITVDVIAVTSLATSVLLTWGWWVRRIDVMQRGLLLTAVPLLGTSINAWMVPGYSWVSGGYGTPWAIGVTLAWLIEVRDNKSRRP